MGIPWGFDGEHGTDVRPPHVAALKAWAKNESQPGANDGTRVTAGVVNRIVGNVRALADAAGSPLTESSDEDILHAVVALIGVTAPAPHTHDARYYQKAETDSLLDTKVPIAAIVDNLASTSAVVPLSAAQGKVLKDLIDGLGDITPVADLAEAATLTGLDRGDLIHVGDNGAGKWARYQVTAVGDGTWAGCTKVLLWTQDQAPATHGHVAGDITDASPNGRSLVMAANYAAMRTLLGLGSAALLTAGTAANNVVQLDGTGKLPAVDGSQLTGMPGVSLASQAEAEAGVENTKAMTALRVAQAIAALAFPAGSVMRTASTAKTDTFTTTSTTDVDLTGLSVAITPTSTSDKILVRAVIKWAVGSSSAKPTWTLLRGATKIAIGDAASSRTRASGSGVGLSTAADGCFTEVIEFLDAPASAAAQTYKIQTKTSASTLYINRNLTDADSAANDRLISTITAQVIKG